MSKRFLLLFSIILNCTLNAELININPDPNGEPWLVGGSPELTQEYQTRLDSIPEMILTVQSANCDLRTSVDNSTEVYFRNIFNQISGECSQAAGIGYVFTYEINLLRDVQAVYVNKYSPIYTYNYLTLGATNAHSSYFDGWDIVKDSGCASYVEWGGYGNNTLPGLQKWMTGYDKYNNTSKNRILDFWQISIETPEGLNNLKHWLNDHNQAAEIGGIACFVAHMYDTQYGILPPESAEAGKSIILQFAPTEGSHAMTIVGYNDEIMYDFDGDGEFANGEEMCDWEIGALKVANSHGITWPTNDDLGFAYLPYRLLAIPGQIQNQDMHVIEVESVTPQLTARVNMTYPSREHIKINTGISEDINSIYPTSVQHYSAYELRKGGDLPMQGFSPDPIEIELDMTNILNTDSKKFFLQFLEFDQYHQYIGEIINFSIIDYRFNSPLEIYCSETNVPIDGFTRVSINYEVLPSSISVDTSIDQEVYVRDDTRISNGTTLTIEENGLINIYDGNLIVETGATLLINPGASFFCSENSSIKVEQGGSLIAIGTEENNILFTSYDGEPWIGIELWESEESSFQHCQIENAETGVLFWQASNETFINNEINDCNVGLLIKGEVPSYRIIDSNNFNNNETGIFLYNIDGHLPDNIFIIHNTIVGDEGTGIYVNNCSRELKIGDNEIKSNKFGIRFEYSDGCKLLGSDQNNYLINENNTGISFFQSTINMENVIVTNNEHYGILFLSDSHPRLINNLLNDNGGVELYCNYGHPVMADGHNDIINTLGGYLGYLYLDNVRTVNCRYNWWGSNPPNPENFEPYGQEYFVYEPWDEFSNHPFSGVGMGENSEAKIAYNEALLAEVNEDYISASIMYDNVIDLYPMSEEALLSLRRKFICEKKSNGNMFALNQYFDSLSQSCLDDTVFYLLSRNLALDCEKEMELYDEVLMQYSNILDLPINEVDSIFTQINVINTLLEIEEIGRSTICLENFPENIRRLNPTDVQESQIKSQNLISNLLDLSDEETSNESLPTIAKLNDNYPNPFNPRTTISFSIPEESKVELSIYNIKGQIVRSLAKDNFDSGEHSVIWFGKDNNDKKCSSGIYFYQLKVNGIPKSVKKCLLLK